MPQDDLVYTYAVDNADQLLSVSRQEGSDPVVLIESFTHDADGNMTTRTNDSKRSVTKSDDTITFAWDDFASAALPKVKLMKVTSADLSGPTSTAKVDNRFDINGIRKRKLDKAGNASAEYTTDIITLASDALGTSTLPTISYIQGHLLLGYEEDGDFRYFLTDGLSSVRDIIDDTGAVIKSYEFNEYGDLITSSGSGTNSPKTWIGGLSANDDTADSGLYLMGYRHYAAGVLGRFISRDPIGHAGGLNLYAYPTNPMRFVDPNGLSLYLYGDNYVANSFLYMLEEATGLDLSLGADRQVRIDGEGSGGSKAARQYLKDIIGSDSCTKIRTLEQERGTYNSNYGLFAGQDATLDMHEIYLRPFRLLKEQGGAPYAYGSLMHEITEASYGAKYGVGRAGYPAAHAHANTAETRVLLNYGIVTVNPDTFTYLENGRIVKLSRQQGWNPGGRLPDGRFHVHTKSVKKSCLWP